MRLLFILLFLFAALAAPTRNVRAASPYLSLAGDVPLAPGLVEEDERAVIFDKPQGRIIQMSATLANSGDIPAISAFYRNALPNLGWQAARDGRLIFIRDSERLEISFIADERATHAILVIRPH